MFVNFCLDSILSINLLIKVLCVGIHTPHSHGNRQIIRIYGLAVMGISRRIRADVRLWHVASVIIFIIFFSSNNCLIDL